tara:strand:+ start:1531 stop:1728 length:198 start_codon:yes stop_codon:yes gene_type:complete
MSNQIKLTIDISEEMLNKIITVIALSGATLPPQMGAMPMVTRQAPPEATERPSMGFQPPAKEGDK